MRSRNDELTWRKCKPIKGAAFTFRTLHHPDARFGIRGKSMREAPMDRTMTVTLAAIDGEKHKMIPHMEVQL